MNDGQLISPFILTQLDLFNWGPFGGRHCAEIDPQGSAVIGPTGSGKTTLVDALMTLLVARPRYNLASTGGHESDRDLISYIRGVTGTGNKIDNNHIARQGRTTTGISAHFSDGKQTVLIGAILWIDGISFAAKDQKDLWLYSDRSDQSLELWLTLHQDGGARALKQYGRQTEGVRVFDTKKAYLAQLRQRFEVSDNAFALLNRAAGLKQLNSIDEIFRELVLEDRSAFSRATEVAAEFDDLTSIHSELETARRQEQSLIPIAKTHKKYLVCKTNLTLHRNLLQMVETWYATAACKGWGELISRIEKKLDEIEAGISELKRQDKALKNQAETLNKAYLQAGGASIEQLKIQLGIQGKLLDERRYHAEQYRQLTRNLGLDVTLTREALRRNQQQTEIIGTQLREELELEKGEQQEVSGNLSKVKKGENEYREEIARINKRPGSNINGRYQEFRSVLATELGISEDSLPFIAQLVQVKAEESKWQGAIERAIGGQRLRILVPPKQMQTALNWVNGRDNRLHVRLVEARAPERSAQFMDDGFTRKLNFKKHPYREVVKSLLAGIDRHCVASPAKLRQTPHGMTVQGLMSGKKFFFEKQDQRLLHQDWMTGFDNKHRLATLTKAREDVAKEQQRQEQKYEAINQRLACTNHKINLLEQLTNVNFDTIDSPGAETALHDMQQHLEGLTDPDSEVGRARRAYEDVKGELAALGEKLERLIEQRGELKTKQTDAVASRESAHNRKGNGLDDEQQTIAEKYFSPLDDKIVLDQLDQAERNERQRLTEAEKRIGEQLSKLGRDLVRQMDNAQKQDTGALSEAGTEIGDIPAYLERLKTLRVEDLPAKLKRFLNYLNQSSDQGVTQLLTVIENEASQIEERIYELNQTLQRVDFQTGRYLQLIPQRVVHESLSTLQKAQRYLRSAALKDDQGESHYRALQNVVKLLRDAGERKNTMGARALLDPRYRLQFSATVLDRHSQKQICEFKGSQSGSGGEKEIIASYILTASLSYALCPAGMTRPLFGSLILDEAFSKSSQAVAGRIILALREFGLHPLFITPNKEMRLLRNHTRSAILVHRKGMKSTLTSMRWEELEAVALKRVVDTSSP